MKLKDLIKKLRAKPNQNDEVEFLIYGKGDGDIVCAEMHGSDTLKVFRILAKRRKKEGHAEIVC